MHTKHLTPKYMGCNIVTFLFIIHNMTENIQPKDECDEVLEKKFEGKFPELKAKNPEIFERMLKAYCEGVLSIEGCQKIISITTREDIDVVLIKAINESQMLSELINKCEKIIKLQEANILKGPALKKHSEPYFGNTLYGVTGNIKL